MTKLEAIRALASAGYALIPLQGKRPISENWEAAQPGRHDEKALSKEGVNYGVVLGPHDLVIDVDPRNYENAEDRPLIRLFKKIGVGIPPETFATKTGGGGLHIFLKKPADLAVRNSLPEFRGVEFKGGPGRQVVGPGSIHPETGKEYVVLQGLPSTVAAAHQALLDLIARKPATFDAKGTDKYQDDEGARERCVRFLKDLPPAVEHQGGDAATLKAAMGLRDRGVSPKVALELLLEHFDPRCTPPWGEEGLAEKVRNAYAYARGPVGSQHPAAHFTKLVTPTPPTGEPTDEQIGKSGWRLDAKKQPIKCFQNLLNYFSIQPVGLRGCFGYNEFARRAEILAPTPWEAQPGLPVTDLDLQRLRAHLARNHGYDANKDDLVDAIVDVSQRRRFHPVRDFLSSLKWDGVKRLDTWLVQYLGAVDDEEGYTRAVGRKTLVAAVARVFEPGCKFDHVLVLEGRQGLGKSGVCKVLGGPWFSDFKMNAAEKDTVQMMQGKWIVEMAELHAARQTDVDTLKAFLTRTVDEARFAYGRLPGQYPRQGIFIATYNPGPDGTYLKDDENRRWWPVRCEGVPPSSRTFDFPGLKSVRDQLWAEAVVRYRMKEPLTMDTVKLQDAAREQQGQRRAEHPWRERIAEWIVERDKTLETALDFYTGREVFLGAMGGVESRYDRRAQLAVSDALRTLGWESPAWERRSGELVRGYKRAATGGAKRELATASSVFGDLL